MDVPSPQALADLGVSVRSCRPLFHRRLLEWFRSPSDAEGLAKLGLLFQELCGTMPDGPLADLLQLTATYLDVLQRGEVAVGPSSQTLLGRLDRVLRPLAATPPGWPGADIRDLIHAFLEEFSRVGEQPARVADIRARYQGSAAVPSESWLAMEPPSMRPSEGASDTLDTSDFSLPVAIGDDSSTRTPSPLMSVTQTPGGVSLAMTEPLIESAESWLEAQTHRPMGEAKGDLPLDLEGLSGLGMGWEASALGAGEGTAVAEETSLDPFAGLGMVISADDLPALLGQPTAAGGDDGTVDALLADALAGVDTLTGVDTLPDLLDQRFKSGEAAEMLKDQLADPMAGLGVEPAAEPLPDLLLEPLEPEPLEPEPLEPEAGARATEELAEESLAAELDSVASLQMLPELHPLPAPGPSPPGPPPPATPMAAERRAGLTADALSAELELALSSLVGPATDVIEPLPVLPPVPAVPESPDLSTMSAGFGLPPAVTPSIAPVAPSVGVRANAAEGPISGAVPPSPRPRLYSNSPDLRLDAVAEMGLNCARLAQRNSQMGCGLAEFDLILRHLRQQLRTLESGAEATIQGDARSGETDRDSTLRQGLRGLGQALTQLVGLRDQLGTDQREAAELLAQQTRLADDLLDGLSTGRTDGAA